MTTDVKSKAIQTFVNTFGGSYKKLDSNDVDFKIFKSDSSPIAYVQVVQKSSMIRTSYPLQIHARKLMKLFDKRMNPVIIWCCDDGIIYAKAASISGEIFFSDKEEDIMVSYQKQKGMKYVRFTQ